MRSLFLLLVSQLFCSYIFAVDAVVNKKISVNSEALSLYRIIPMPDGGSLLVSRTNTGNTQKIIRSDAQGQIIWAKSLYQQGATFLHAAGVFADSSIYVIYGVHNDGHYFIVKLSDMGTVQWTNELNLNVPCFEAPETVHTLPDGGMIFSPRLYFSLAAIRLDSDGAVVSSYRTRDTSTKTMSMDALATSNGGMVLACKDNQRPAIITVTPNQPTQILSISGGFYHRPYSIIKTYDNNYLLAGMASDSGNVAFALKITPTGTIVWNRFYKGVLQTTGNQRLSAITQLVENADHTLTAVGYAGGDNGTVTSCLGVIMKLSEDGDVLSAYSHVIKTSNPAFYNDVYPHLYETVGNKLLISTEEHDTTAGYSQPILIDPAAMSNYCMANPFTPIIRNLTDYIVVSTNSPFSEITMPTITHPTVYTQNITTTLNLKDLCGVPLSTYLDEVSANGDMKLIPNPTQVNSNVSVSWDATELAYATVQLYDVSGRLVKQVNVTNGNQSILNLSQLQPGIYVCRLVNSNGELVAVRKLMITE